MTEFLPTKTIFHYDNTFWGFLSCIFDIYAAKTEVAQITSQDTLSPSFDMQIATVVVDNEKSRRVADGVVKKIGSSGMSDIYSAFASCNTEKEIIIYKYLKLVFVYGRKIEQMLSNADVITFNEMLQRVRFECHRYNGFVRFRETESSIFVAPIRPDNDILEFIMPHFVNRFGIQRFVIVDVGRGKAGYFDGKNWDVGQFEGLKDVELTQNEKEFQQMWKNYYDTVTIKPRESERRRKQFMPQRYWEFMPEIKTDMQKGISKKQELKELE